jgi:glycine cleavage system aminomethyltransferase T
MEAGAPHGMVYGCMASMIMRRIEAGILDNLSDFDHSMTPFAAGLGKFIDLDKEGFIGREALLVADRRSRLPGL